MYKIYCIHIHEIYMLHTIHTHDIYMTYFLHLHSILWVYTAPGGWCCGGGQGPIPPDPPAITSPGRVITLILLHSNAHFWFLLLCMWIRRARLELKIAGKCHDWHSTHTNRSSSTSVITLPENVPKTRESKATPKSKGGWNWEWNVIQGIYQVYAGIYLVYSEYLNVAKGLDPTATPALLSFIMGRPYVSGYPLHIPVSPSLFAEMYTL